jgi:thiol:disulfide interchange protein
MTRNSRLLFILVAVLTASLAVRAQAGDDHLKVQLISEQATVAPGSTATVGLLFKMAPHWHIYWVNPGDSGEAPNVKWQLPQGASVGDFQWPTPKKLSLASLIDYGYEDTVLLAAPLQVPANATGTLPLKAHVRWLVCAQICLPGQGDLSLDLPVAANASPNAANAAIFRETRERLPKPVPAPLKLTASQDKDSIHLQFAAKGTKEASFFPLESEKIEDSAPQKVATRGGATELTLTKSTHLDGDARRLHGVLVVNGQGYEVDLPLALSAGGHYAPETPVAAAISPATPAQAAQAAPTRSAPSTSSALALLLAFLGGIVLNFMPCVFPVLSIKVLSFVQVGAEQRGRLRRQGLFYTLGILASFWVLVTVLLVLRGAGRHIGWGFQLQSPGFVAALAALMLLFGLNLAGVFEVGYSLMGVGSNLANRGGDAGAFFTGVLATVVATPCTAPFMGTAVGFALSQPAWVCVAVFTALAIGLAAPFLLLAFQPAWVRLLPKPGRWMETMKQLFSFPLFATAVWLVWVFGRQTSVDATARLLGMLLGLSLAGWIIGRWPSRQVATVVAIVLMATSIFLFSRTDLRSERASVADGKWVPYSADKLAEYRSQGRPVFVDFTAAWCLTCQVNERAVLSKPEFLNKVGERNVVLMKADWTSYDPAITQALASLGRSAVPLYVIYDSDASRPANVLPEGILTPQTVLQALDASK